MQTKTGALGIPRIIQVITIQKFEQKHPGVKNNPPDLTSSEITLDEEGNNAAILWIIEEVHQHPACHLRARDNSPPSPVDLVSQDVKQPAPESAVHSLYPKSYLRPAEASCYRRWQRKGDRGRREE